MQTTTRVFDKDRCKSVETLQATSLRIQNDWLARPMFFERHIRTRKQLARNLRERGRMQQHICVRRVCHRARALACGDAVPQIFHRADFLKPDRFQIIIRLPQIADRLRANAARPHVAVRRDVSARPTREARNDLPLFEQRALCHLIIARTERLRDARKAERRRRVRVIAEEIGDGRVIARQRRDVHADRVEFDALFRDFGDVRVRRERLQTGVNVREAFDVELRDDRVNAEDKVRVLLLQFLQRLPRFHRLVPIAGNKANVVMLRADAVERKVDADARLGRVRANLGDAVRDARRENAVCWNRNIFRLAVLVRRDDHLGQIFAQEWLAAGEGHVDWSAPDVLEHARPFVEREVVVRLAPHVARPAFAVATVRHADNDAERQEFRKAETVEGPVERDFGGERSEHLLQSEYPDIVIIVTQGNVITPGRNCQITSEKFAPKVLPATQLLTSFNIP